MRIWISLLAGLFAASAGAASLKDVLDKVWERNPKAQALAARQEEIAARRTVAQGLLPGPPTAGVSYLTDQLADNRGLQEWEADLEFPLWLPGERQARQALAEHQETGLEAEARALRLDLAGELREAIWAVALAEVEHRLAKQREVDVRTLEHDVTRRVKVGELAQTDLLLALDEVLLAQQVTLEKTAALKEVRRVYRVLTGIDELPTQPQEPTVDEQPPHPALELSLAATSVAQAKVRAAVRALDERPQIIVGAKRERPEFGADSEHSVRVGVRIPLGSERFRRPEVAAAQAELAEAASYQDRALDRITLAVKTAREVLGLETERLELARQKRLVASEHLGLARRSFDLGHSDLVALLRIRAIAVAAELELARQQIQVSRARARLNQAQGVLP